MDEKPTLATLPPEMQKAIGNTQDDNDLIAFRQLSRDMRSACEDAFLECYFQERIYTYSPYGLARLAELTAHSHLIKKLESIELAAIDPESFVTSDEERHGDRARELAQKWEVELAGLVKHDMDLHLLALILRHLQFAGRLVTFSLSGGTDFERTFAATGLANVEHVLGVEHFQRPNEGARLFYRYFRGDCSRMINSFFRAVAITDYPLTDLNLCFEHREGSFKSGGLAGIDISTLRKLSNAWKSLSSLSMGFAWGEERWYIAQDHGLKALLASASKITDLVLYNDGQEDVEGKFSNSDTLGWFAAAFANHALRHVELRGFDARSDQFATFLLEHRDTLKGVTLQTASIQPHECWSEVFRVVAGDLQLDSLLCFCLMKGSSGGDIVSIDENDELVLLEAQAIKQCLDRVLEEGVKYVAWPGHRVHSDD